MPPGVSKFNPATSTVDDADTLPTPVNEVTTSLDGALAPDTSGNVPGVPTELALIDASKLPNAGWVSVGAEIIEYEGKNSNKLTNIVRAAQSSPLQGHSDRSLVAYNLTAQHLQVLIDTIIALQNQIISPTLQRRFDTGTISGATINLANTPAPGEVVLLWIGGVFNHEGIDFTRVGATITINAPLPPNGTDYTAHYLG